MVGVAGEFFDSNIQLSQTLANFFDDAGFADGIESKDLPVPCAVSDFNCGANLLDSDSNAIAT